MKIADDTFGLNDDTINIPDDTAKASSPKIPNKNKHYYDGDDSDDKKQTSKQGAVIDVEDIL